MLLGTGTALWHVSAESQKVTSFCLVAKTRPKIDLSRIRLSVWGPSLPVFVRAWPGPGASGPAPSPSGHFCLLLWSGTKRSKHLVSPAVFPCTLGPFPSFPGPLLHFRERPPSFGSLSPGMRGGSTFPRFGSPSQGAPGSVSVCRRSAPSCSGALLRVFRASSLWGRLSFRSLGHHQNCLPLSLCSCTGSVALLSRDSAVLPPLLEWKVFTPLVSSRSTSPGGWLCRHQHVQSSLWTVRPSCPSSHSPPSCTGGLRGRPRLECRQPCCARATRTFGRKGAIWLNLPEEQADLKD